MVFPVKFSIRSGSKASSSKAPRSNQSKFRKNESAAKPKLMMQFNQNALISKHCLKGVEGGICTAATIKILHDLSRNNNEEPSNIINNLLKKESLVEMAAHQRGYQKDLEVDLATGGFGFGPFRDAIYRSSSGRLDIMNNHMSGFTTPRDAAEILETHIKHADFDNPQLSAIVIEYGDRRTGAVESHTLGCMQRKISDNQYETYVIDMNQGVFEISSNTPEAGVEAIKQALSPYSVEGETYIISGSFETISPR